MTSMHFLWDDSNFAVCIYSFSKKKKKDLNPKTENEYQPNKQILTV